MDDQYINGVDKAAQDHLVTTALADIADADIGSALRIGIRNESSQIYRVLTLSSIAAFMELSEQIEGFGFRNEFDDNVWSGREYLAIFQPPERRRKSRTQLGANVRRILRGKSERRAQPK